MKIVFCGGGTGGHIMPNIALIKRLQNHDCFYIGTNGMEKTLTVKMVQSGQIKEFRTISAAKLQRKITAKNLLLPISIIKSINQSKKYLKELSPDVVFGKGGFVSLPVILAARSLKIPTIIHESDMTLGLANKISALFSNEVLTTYPTDNPKYKTTGAIIRDEILTGDKATGLKFMKFDGSKPVLLILGGSLGASALNNAICRIGSILSKQFDIFVISGKGKKLECEYIHQAEFVADIKDIYAATNICVSRAGSNVMAELTLAHIPFIAVPLEKCSRGEQIKNAEWYAKNRCCVYVPENELSEKLSEKIKTTYTTRREIIRAQCNQSNLYGTDNVISKILQYAK